ncbi:MAG TPA: oligoribonuclease [Acidobacteriota bacterium]|nr:oligoribonuclease [Acidobacteriota bacterium]
MSDKREGLLVWMDLEMTGLDPDKERIIEMVTLVTDAQLNIVARGPELVIHQSDRLLAAMDDWNQRHHAQSGLIERVRASTLSEGEAERRTLDFLTPLCQPRSAPLAGNSVHHDRRFLARYMPRLEQFLHYRNVDVSTVKELAARWYPDIFSQAPEKSKNHRALDDLLESIEELKFYRRNIFA